jgi:cytochrome P450
VVDGKTIPAGQRIFFMLGAANHDPRHYDAPEKFDITRQNIKHMSFGFGIHYCIGTTLGRLEAQIAVDTLLRRLPNLRLAEDVTYQDNHSFHAPIEVRLTFDAATK